MGESATLPCRCVKSKCDETGQNNIPLKVWRSITLFANALRRLRERRCKTCPEKPRKYNYMMKIVEELRYTHPYNHMNLWFVPPQVFTLLCVKCSDVNHHLGDQPCVLDNGLLIFSLAGSCHAFWALHFMSRTQCQVPTPLHILHGNQTTRFRRDVANDCKCHRCDMFNRTHNGSNSWQSVAAATVPRPCERPKTW